MKKSWVDGGRVETVVALAVLAAVVGLFLRFYRPADTALPPADGLHAPAPAGPVSSPPSR